MYSKKLEYFKEKYEKENCASGIITTTIEWFPVGSPCIVSANSFNTRRKVVAIDPDEPQSASFDSFSEPVLDSAKKPASPKRASMMDLHEMARNGQVDEANDILHGAVTSVGTLFLFPNWNDRFTHFNNSIHSRQFRLNGITPLIFDDNFKQIIPASLDDLNKRKNFSSVAGAALEYLKTYRYVNYVLNGVAESNKKAIVDSIGWLFDGLCYRFPVNTCFGQHSETRARILIDTICVSFYRLSDVIPLFDYKTVGLGMELLMTNSQMSGAEMIRRDLSPCYRFLFSETRENVFTIDGDVIERPNDIKVTNALGYIEKMIKNEVPNDFALTNKPILLEKSAQEEI